MSDINEVYRANRNSQGFTLLELMLVLLLISLFSGASFGFMMRSKRVVEFRTEAASVLHYIKSGLIRNQARSQQGVLHIDQTERTLRYESSGDDSLSLKNTVIADCYLLNSYFYYSQSSGSGETKTRTACHQIPYSGGRQGELILILREGSSTEKKSLQAEMRLDLLNHDSGIIWSESEVEDTSAKELLASVSVALR